MNETYSWKYQFEARDFLDARGLGAKLLHPPSEPVRQVAALIAPDSLARLAAAADRMADEALVALLLPAFNQLLAGPVILDANAKQSLQLRQVTEKWWQRHPTGKDLRRLNKLLLQDVFPGELWHEDSVPLGPELCSGVQFRVYRVSRAGKKAFKEHFSAIYTGPAGRRSVWATTRQKLTKKMNKLAKDLLKGNAPLSKEERQEHLRRSRAYTAVIKLLAEAMIRGEEAVEKFVANAVQAQLAIGLNQPLLPFVFRALAAMPKTEKQQPINQAFLKYKAFCKTGRQVQPETLQKRLNTVERFVSEISFCEGVAEALLDNLAKSNSKSSVGELTTEVSQAELEAAAATIGKVPPNFGCHQVSASGIQVWLRRQPYEERTRGKTLTVLRHFFRFLRDHEHALATGPTAADLVPMPSAPRRQEPVSVLWWDQIWDIFLNLPDVEAVLFFGLSIFAGLHQTEIHRLEWKDISWDKGEPTELLVRSCKGPPGQVGEKRRHIRILYPLNKLLKVVPPENRKGPLIAPLGKPRSYNYIQRLAKRLGIPWDESIMRHTAASFLYSAGLTLGEVGAYLGDMERTVGIWYLRKLPMALAELHWSLPFSTKIFVHLPMRRIFWDHATTFKRICLPQGDIRELVRDESTNAGSLLGLRWQIACSTTYLPPQYNRRAEDGRYVRDGRKWPSDLEFQVLLWDMSPDKIARRLKVDRSSVFSYIARGNFLMPPPNYWRKHRWLRPGDPPLPIPPLIHELRKILQAQQAELDKNGKVVVPSKRGEQNTDPESVIVPFGVKVKGKGLLPAPSRRTPLVR